MGPHRLAVVLFAVPWLGCIRGPEARPERALYLDLRRVVETRERTEWVIDRTEVESLRSTVMHSACQAPDAVRRRTLAWLDDEIDARGGSAEAAYHRAGDELTGAVDELRTLERVRLLARDATAQATQCPFWLRERPQFEGLHGTARRFAVLLESQGGGALILRGDTVALGGGAAGRLLPAWGVNEHLTLALGAEAGGLGTLNTGGADDRALKASVIGAVPLLLRVQEATRIYDFEVAVTGRLFDGAMQPGVRVTAGIGVSTLRVGAFMPVGLLYVSYELQPEADALPMTHTFRIGTRVGINFSP